MPGINIKLPVFIIEGLDITVYSTIFDACQAVEPIDVQDNVYTCFDAEGQVLQLITDGKAITLLSNDKYDASRLRILLAERLQYNTNYAVDELPLGSLVELAKEYLYR